MFGCEGVDEKDWIDRVGVYVGYEWFGWCGG